jgi:NAD+ synthase (glutamine-hydrolysing)
LNYHTGNFSRNTEKIISAIKKSKGHSDLVVFAELGITGYPPRDFLEFTHFQQKTQECLAEIARECTGIWAIVGAPAPNLTGRGKPLFNAAYVLGNGQVLTAVKKTLLPTYDVFDEYRYFEPNREFACVDIAGKRVAVTICEDLWNVDEAPLYVDNPMERLMTHTPALVVNIAASPFSQKQQARRSEVLARNAIKYRLPVVYVNHIGAQTELVFDGDSKVVAPNGEIVAQLPQFEEAIETIDLDNLPIAVDVDIDGMAQVEGALVLGIRDYFGKLGLQKAILGLSGGIDSAVVCVLAVKALGRENVLSVLMPSAFTHPLSVSQAQLLCQNLGSPHVAIPIDGAVGVFGDTLAPFFSGYGADVTEENLQARARAVYLMALSNKWGHILLNTTNKSEMAVGYGTLYGDLCGGLSVIGDLYKTEVYALARRINHGGEVIPSFILERAPSAELRENQRDTDSLPGYEVLDRLLYDYLEKRMGPDELVAAGHHAHVIAQVLRLVNGSEWKRYQTAPILRVSDKAFGMGRRMPIVAKYQW